MESKMKLIYSCLVAIFIGYISISFSGDPPNGNTGAPGDQNCSSCHSPPSSNPPLGEIVISGLTDDPLIPNKTYNLTITINVTSGSAFRAGFQMVILDGNSSSSSSAGTFSGLGAQVAAATSGNRTYLEHSPEKNFSNNTASYTANWTAPASAPNGISFYAIANLANSGGTNDDVIIEHSIQDRALPVVIADFNLINLNDKVLISWITAKETNSDKFELLRSTDTKNYEVIATLDAAGQSDSSINYEFIDHYPPANRPVYYRLRQLDYDGSAFYSYLVSTIIYKDYTEDIKLFPNPLLAGECLFAELVMDEDQYGVSYEVLDRMGRRVSRSNKTEFNGHLRKGFNKLVVDTSGLPEGSYVLLLRQNGQIFKKGNFLVFRQ
jgi:hypothetical protein